MDKAEDTSDIANSLFQLHQTIEDNVQKKKREIVGEYVSWLNQVRELEEMVGKMFLLSFFFQALSNQLKRKTGRTHRAL
jgi:hypothetical protein